MAQRPNLENVNRRILELDQFPTLPSIAVDLVHRWNDPEVSLANVTDLISKDASLSSKVLQVANSAKFGLKKEVSSLHHAGALLGLNALRCITLGVTVMDLFADYQADWTNDFEPDEFWRHNLGVAIASEMLAERFSYPSPEEAFLGGLIHDIGKLGLLTVMPEDYMEVVRKASAGSQTLLEHEKQSLSVTHTEVGKWIAEKWNLPEKFRKAIWLHHQNPGAYQDKSESSGHLEWIVYIADHLVRRSRIGNAGNQYLQNDDLWLQQNFGFDSDDLSDFTEELLPRVQAAGEVLDLETPTIQVYLKSLEDANRILAGRGLEAEVELVETRERTGFLKKLSEIANLSITDGPELDVLAKAVDLIRDFIDLKWALVLTHDTSYQTVQGVLFTEGLSRPESFYRVLNLVEEERESLQMRGRSSVSLLGETVLSSGKRMNLRDSVMRILQTGSLLAIPINISDEIQGECFIDTTGSKLQQTRYRNYLESLLDASAKLYERVRLFRRVQRESESATDALRRESEAHRQLFHFERLASVGRLAAGAAHEINNPLAVISGKAQILLMSEGDPEKAESLNSIINQTMRISKIISDLMGYARPAEPEVADTRIAPLIDNALYMARHRFPDNHVDTMIDVPENVPELRVDGRQIEQVLVNLFVNAIQAMNQEGILTVRAEYIDGAGMVNIHVTDTGPGIPTNDLSRIFDPFFTTKREGEGTGLGLAVSHRIIDNHGGRLTVNSQVGRGTTFTLQLPCPGEAEILPIRKSSGKRPVRKSGKKRILIVDDEKQLSDLMRDFLRDAGYTVEQAMDGIEAMGRLENKVYDVMILDLRMPRKDGLEVLEELRKTTSGMSILVVTGLASNEEIDQAAAYGADKILRKPFQLDELLHAVEEISRKSSASSD
ncbi:MAG: HDOD domain-containing protein [Candidatus Omnitrophica bacterium]|nr:HDOD domain-containing protein [Candidatus Omnitrophota bacterium]MCA9423831.1 HDOD domain-containing protein [Candidatus Omnitrophota bacterium]MCA9434194.1 HDOD domain-containing protein [Candidatus Omnitrophota bacterium]MCA9445493.1 HDOD domain-containing protein [Candidatus Omnitrophota bacterium]MCB9768078.1 HDOD domain-containing protein [Candidatus Omnitrophota bacterium]